MGLRKGTLTFSRYRLIGTLPDNFPAFFNERIRHNAFQTVWRTADEKATGWTGLDDPLDTEFPYASYAQGRYLLFSLRVDRKSVAPALLRLRILEADRNKLAETGQKKLYREQREAIREGVRLELLGKTLPVPAFFEACWSVPENTLLFCSLSDKVFEELQELFRDSFKLALCPYLPWELPPEPGPARASGAEAGTAGTVLPSVLPGIDPAAIGREFLTWLWFKSEERNGTVMLPDEGAIGVDFIRRLVLESGEGEYAESIVCQGLHSDLKEGKEALRQGKKITAARLKISHNQTEWEFTFKADRFHFQSLKLPTLPDQEGDEADKEGQLLERIYLVDRAVQLMDLLFQSFLTIRRTGAWEQEQSRMLKWIEAAD
ncbi:MAG: recombination-associated protein RdgC [Deltaproteobacteria bacterium]|nr:recombination-associated protein RdgC [Deltaproteobacteria bacterium]